MKVCFVAEYGNKTAGGGKSLLSLMLILREKYGVTPILVCHKNFELIENAKNNDIEAHVISSRIFAYGKENISFLAYLKYPLKRFYNFLQSFKISKFLVNQKIDLVHLNSSLSCVEWAICAKRMKIPYIWHIREYLESDHNRQFIGKKFHYQLIRNSNAVITISKDIQNYWEKKLNRACLLVYNGLEVNKYYKNANAKLSDSNIRCIMMGRIVDGKRQLDAVKTIEILIAKKITNIHLHIIGYRGESEYEKCLVSYIKEKQLEKFVQVTEYTSNLESFLNDSDIGLMCSTREAFGRVTIEYMLSGLLCIGSNTGGTLELIENNKTGFLFEMGNPESLAQKLEWVLENREESKKILLNGQKNAMEKFSIEHTASNVYSIYKKYINI